MQRIGAWLLSLALLKATASEQSSGAVETSEHDSVCAGGEFCGQESDPSSTASDNDLPPILNFGSLDGYYRVLAGEIGIVGVRRYVCLAFVAQNEQDVESGFAKTEAARDAFFEIAKLAQQAPADDTGKRVTFTEVPFPLDVPFGRKEHLANVLDLDREWVTDASSRPVIRFVDIFDESVETVATEATDGIDSGTPAFVEQQIARIVLQREPNLLNLQDKV